LDITWLVGLLYAVCLSTDVPPTVADVGELLFLTDREYLVTDKDQDIFYGTLKRLKF